MDVLDMPPALLLLLFICKILAGITWFKTISLKQSFQMSLIEVRAHVKTFTRRIQAAPMELNDFFLNEELGNIIRARAQKSRPNFNETASFFWYTALN
jgi:hypothetical protein